MVLEWQLCGRALWVERQRRTTPVEEERLELCRQALHQGQPELQRETPSRFAAHPRHLPFDRVPTDSGGRLAERDHDGNAARCVHAKHTKRTRRNEHPRAQAWIPR
jgi:hypothetical protein